VTAAVSARIAPCERSKPPPISTKARPRARTPTMLACVRMLVSVPGVKNRSVRTIRTSAATTSAICGRRFSRGQALRQQGPGITRHFRVLGGDETAKGLNYKGHEDHKEIDGERQASRPSPPVPTKTSPWPPASCPSELWPGAWWSSAETVGLEYELQGTLTTNLTNQRSSEPISGRSARNGACRALRSSPADPDDTR